MSSGDLRMRLLSILDILSEESRSEECVFAILEQLKILGSGDKIERREKLTAYVASLEELGYVDRTSDLLCITEEGVKHLNESNSD